MSQSDYLNKKKNVIQVQNQNESSPVLDSSIYTKNKSYSISINITNSLITPSQLFQQTTLNTQCSKFITCTGTNNRPNRVINNSPLYSNVRKYVKQRKQVGCKNLICRDLT
jgi:hypothetical protein